MFRSAFSRSTCGCLVRQSYFASHGAMFIRRAPGPNGVVGVVGRARKARRVPACMTRRLRRASDEGSPRERGWGCS